MADKTGWFVSAPRASRPALRLFCVPFAGGSASFCSTWSKYLPPSVEIVGIQPPGREQRFGETPFTEVHTLVGALVPLLKTKLSVPFAMFGHSIGASIAYEAISELQRQGLPQPVIFFASGRQAPPYPEHEPPIYSLPDDEFCREFLQRSSSNKELEEWLAQDDVREMFLPQLKADYQLAETYEFHADRAVQLACPIVAMDGEGGDGLIEDHELIAWREYTSGPFRSCRFPGDHFFIDSSRAQVLNTISTELLPFLK